MSRNVVNPLNKHSHNSNINSYGSILLIWCFLYPFSQLEEDFFLILFRHFDNNEHYGNQYVMENLGIVESALQKSEISTTICHLKLWDYQSLL